MVVWWKHAAGKHQTSFTIRLLLSCANIPPGLGELLEEPHGLQRQLSRGAEHERPRADVGGVLAEAVDAGDEERGRLARPRPCHGDHIPALCRAAVGSPAAESQPGMP